MSHAKTCLSNDLIRCSMGPLTTAEDISEQPRPRGQLDVKHHGLHKFKKVRKFRCKLSDTVYLSRKVVNDHHKQNHDKCICNICGKKCNFPHTLACHKYSHQGEKSMYAETVVRSLCSGVN